jgi:hypothetical protein
MPDVAVLTIKVAARALGGTHYTVTGMLARRELSSATVDGRAAVLVDELYLKAKRRTRKAAA